MVRRFSRTVTSSVQIPATLRSSRTQAAVLFLVCLLFVLGGIWMVRDGKPMGYFCGGFFALGLPVFALQFHPKAAYLHLAADGFTFCSLFRAHTVRWGPRVCRYLCRPESDGWVKFHAGLSGDRTRSFHL